MTDKKVNRMVLTALMIGLTAVATMVITIPVIGTQGFVNFGDVVIFITAIFFGPTAAALAGGLGSALGDLLLAYAHWAPYTLVIKGLEGLVAGLFAYQMMAEKRIKWGKGLIGLILAALVMVVGYYLGGGLMFGFKVSILSVPQNIFQGLASVAVSLLLALALRKLDLDILKKK